LKIPVSAVRFRPRPPFQEAKVSLNLGFFYAGVFIPDFQDIRTATAGCRSGSRAPDYSIQNDAPSFDQPFNALQPARVVAAFTSATASEPDLTW
jgi:hypothetical protein